MKLRKFKRGDNYFFQLLRDDGNIILESQSYQTKDARDNGVDSIRDNIRNADRYEKLAYDGKSYFILKAGNGQEVARSPRFENDTELEAALRYAQTGAQDDGGEAYGTDGKTDDYKPLRYYESHISGVKDGFDKFFADSEHYFTYNLDAQVYMISEGYKSESARDHGISSVKKNMRIEARFQREQHPNGKFLFNLKAGNNQEIATSRWFEGADDRDGFISRLLGGKTPSVDKVIAPIKAVAKKVVEEPKKPRKKRAKKPKVEKIEVSTGPYACNDIKYQIFISGNGKHYFTYRNKENKAILISSNIRGFITKEEVDVIIEQIAACGSKSSNFEEKTTVNNKFYYYLKNDDGKNIGKSFFFNTQEEMREAKKLFDCGGVVRAITDKAKLTESTNMSGRREDDYLSCKVYQSHINNKQPKYNDFIIFHEEDEYYFAWTHGDNIVMRSEGYTTESARDNGIESVRKNRDLEERFSIEEKMGYHFTVLKAGNHQEIARSCPSKDRTGAMYWFPSSIKAREEAKKAAAASIPKESTKPKDKEDDYLACKEYEGRVVNDKQNIVALFKHKGDGQFYFALYDNDGNVKLRSERFRTANERDEELSGVLKYHDNRDMYKRIKRGNYYMEVLYDKTGREVGRSCLKTEKKAVPIVAAKAAAIAIPAVKKEAKTTAPIVAEKSSGGFNWWWLLLPLLLALSWFLYNKF